MNKKLKFVIVNFPELIAGIALFSAILITTINGVGRYVFSHTFVWTDEIVALCFAYTVFFGSAAACRRGMHYGLELVSTALPQKGKKYLNAAIALISLVLIATLAYLAWVLISHVGTKIMTATRISYRWFDLGMALGLSLMVVYAAIICYKRIKELFKKSEPMSSGSGEGAEQ